MCFICSDLAVPKNRQIYLINGIYVHVYTKCTFKCKYVYNGLIKKAIRISWFRIAFGEVNSILKNDRPNPKKQKRHSIRISRKTYRRDYICPGKSHAGWLPVYTKRQNRSANSGKVRKNTLSKYRFFPYREFPDCNYFSGSDFDHSIIPNEHPTGLLPYTGPRSGRSSYFYNFSLLLYPRFSILSHWKQHLMNRKHSNRQNANPKPVTNDRSAGK